MPWSRKHSNALTLSTLWGWLGGLHTRVQLWFLWGLYSITVLLLKRDVLSLADWLNSVASMAAWWNTKLPEKPETSMTKFFLSKVFRIPKSGQLGVKITDYHLQHIYRDIPQEKYGRNIGHYHYALSAWGIIMVVCICTKVSAASLVTIIMRCPCEKLPPSSSTVQTGMA